MDIGREELFENATVRVPVCLCLDTSGSMGIVEGGEYVRTGKTFVEDGRTFHIVKGNNLITRIGELKKGINRFVEAIKEDGVASYSADICLVTFDSNAKKILDFRTVENLDKIPDFSAEGDTRMGEGVNLALDLLENRKQQYKEAGVEYFQPWLVLMTDGVPNGDENELERAIARTREMIEDEKLTIFPIGIGEKASMETLKRFSPRRTPVKLKELKFQEFFEWLGNSVSIASQSRPGEKVSLDEEGMYGWGEL